MTDFLITVGLLILLVIALDVIYRAITGSTVKPNAPRGLYLLAVPAGAVLLFLVLNFAFDLPRFWERFSAGAAAVIMLYATHLWFWRRRR